MASFQLDGLSSEHVQRAAWREVGEQLSESELLRRAEMLERGRWAKIEEITLLFVLPLLAVLMAWEALR